MIFIPDTFSQNSASTYSNISFNDTPENLQDRGKDGPILAKN